MKISNEHLAIGVPLNFPLVPAAFFFSFVLMEKPSFTFIHDENGGIADLRNNIVEKAMLMGATKLLMLDTDQVYPVDTITKLLKHKLPVVGGCIPRRYPPFDNVIMKVSDDHYEPLEDYKDGDLIECDATGGGCVMFDMSIFKKLPYPWFRFQKDPQTGMVIGEDIGLCQDLKAAGYKIYVDTSVKIGHLSTMVINEATRNLYKAMKTSKENKITALGMSDGAQE